MIRREDFLIRNSGERRDATWWERITQAGQQPDHRPTTT